MPPPKTPVGRESMGELRAEFVISSKGHGFPAAVTARAIAPGQASEPLPHTTRVILDADLI